MPRRILIQNSENSYHVTNRSNNKEWFYIPLMEAWDIFCQKLTRSSEMYETEIHTFVLMANHYHLILRAKNKNMDRFMRHFQTEVCREVQRRAGRINHVFGTRYKWSSLWNPVAYAYAYKYVARNPIKALVCNRVEDYPFSTISQSKNLNFSLPLTERIDHYASHIPKPIQDRLDWLNLPAPKEAESVIGKALRRAEFKFSKGNDLRPLVEAIKASYGILENTAAPDTFSAEK